jgi:hypothetical protein
MVNLKFIGQEEGSPFGVSVTVSGTTRSASVRRAGLADPRHTVGSPASQRPFGISATVASPRAAITDPCIPRTLFANRVVSTLDSARRARVSFDNANILRDRAYIGAEVDVRRVLSGEPTHIGTYTVTDANFGAWHRVTKNADQAFDASGYYHYFHNHGAADAFWDMRPRWLGVAAVDAGGALGAIGYASYTPASMASGSEQPNNNTITLGSGYTTGGALSAPGNVTATAHASGPRTVHLTHDPVPGAIAYIHFVSWDDPTTHPVAPYIEIDADALEEWDELLIRKRFLSHSIEDCATRTMGFRDNPNYGQNRITPNYNWHGMAARDEWVTTSMVAYDGPISGLDWAYRWQVDGLEDGAEIVPWFQYWVSDASRVVPVVGETFTFKLEVYASRALDLTMEFGLTGVPNTTVSLVPGWQSISLDRDAVTPQGSGVGYWRLVVPSDGNPFEIRVAAPEIIRGSRTNLFPETIADRTVSGMTIRDHTFIKQAQGYFVEDIIAPDFRGLESYSVHQFLVSCAATNTIPWLQVETFLRPSEWEYIADYLCAPVASGTPGALRRQELGRDAPWVDAFDRILFEFGNEAWNSTGGFYNPPTNHRDNITSVFYDQNGQGYGLHARFAAKAMESTANWSSKIEYVLGGHARSDFGGRAVTTFRKPCYVGIANYNGGWDVNGDIIDLSPQSYQNVLTSAASQQVQDMDDLVTRLQTACTETGLTYGTDVKPTCYEAGPGYQLNGLNGVTMNDTQAIEQEVVMKSVAAGTATLHTALLQASRGFDLFNYFILGSGNTWKSHAPEFEGGAVYPSYQVVRKLNEIFGDRFKVIEATYDNSRAETVLVQDEDGEDANVPTTFAFRVLSETYAGREGLVVGSLRQDTTQPVFIDTGWSDLSSLNGSLLLGDHRLHNRYPVGQRRTAAGEFEADPLSVDITMSDVTLTGLNQVVTPLHLGFGSGGIPTGNCGIFWRDA